MAYHSPQEQDPIREQELRLIRAIRESPEDDSARLAYADFMASLGHFRGSYVRAAVEAEQTDLPAEQRQQAAQQAARQWVENNARDTDRMMRDDLTLGQPDSWRLRPFGFWAPIVHRPVGQGFRAGDGRRWTGFVAVLYRRGFAHRIATRLPDEAPVDRLAAVLSRAPVRVLEVDLRTAAAVMPRPEAALVRQLEIDGVEAAEPPGGWGGGLDRIERLRLRGPRAVEAWQALHASTSTHALRDLAISGAHIDAEGLSALLASARDAVVKRLDLAGSRLDHEARALLLRLLPPDLPYNLGLREEDLVDNPWLGGLVEVRLPEDPDSFFPCSYASLRADACAHPHDEGARRRLAVWLERLSPERAAAVRGEPAPLADLLAFDMDAGLEATEGTMQRIEATAEGWTAQIDAAVAPRVQAAVTYEHGLPSRVSLRARDDVDRGMLRALLGCYPVASALGPVPQAAEALRGPEGGSLQELSLLVEPQHAEALAELLAQPRARRLRRLAVAGPPEAGAALAEALRRVGTLPALAALEIAVEELDTELLELALDGSSLPHLSSLSLPGCALDPLAFEALRRAPQRLGRLLLGHPTGDAPLRELTLDADGLCSYTCSRAASCLDELRVTWAGLPPGAGSALASSAQLGALRSLSLRGNPLDDDDATALLDSIWLPALEDLDLSDTSAGSASLVEHLRWRRGLPRLRRLGLGLASAPGGGRSPEAEAALLYAAEQVARPLSIQVY